jgi:hypothetical protein
MVKLTGINVFPIKSVAGLSLDHARLEKKGFAWDRRWMLVDEQGTFISQRSDPKLTRIQIKYNQQDRDLILTDRRGQQESIRLPLMTPEATETITVQIWDDQCKALRMEKIYDNWFSEVLGRSCRLVFMPDAVQRPVNQNYARPGDQVSFADGFPYLLTSESSLADLNEKLDHPVGMQRFRANLIISGNDPWSEDSWKQFSIGQVRFRSLKPCPRCTLITVDPQTGEKGVEPLKTLSTFRKEKNKVLFGINACWDYAHPGDSMEIAVGDPLVFQ